MGKRTNETKFQSIKSKRLKSESADNEAIAKIYPRSQKTDDWIGDDETVDAIQIYVNKRFDVNSMDGITTVVRPIVKENIPVPTQSSTENLIEMLSNSPPKKNKRISDFKQVKAINELKNTPTQSVVKKSQRRNLHLK